METHITADDGVRLRFRDRGTGPTVVLVHGWKGSHRLWDKTATRLVDSGHRVVAYDLRGMGESDKPAAGYDFDHMAADLGAVIRTLGLDDATVVGWSMGCSVALSYMERGGVGVGRVVLTNGPLRLTQAPDFPHAMPAEQLDGYLAALEDGWPLSEHAFQTESTLAGEPPLVDWLFAVALQTPLDVALAIVRAQAELDHRQAVRDLSVPVLAAYARQDPFYPLSLPEWIAEHAPDGRSAILEGSGHATPIEEPGPYAALIADFAAGRI